ncbi:uncharacterized, partial [Tachysurus ichikawai]
KLVGDVTGTGCRSRARELLLLSVFCRRRKEQHLSVELCRENDGCFKTKSRLDVNAPLDERKPFVKYQRN